MKKIKSLLVVMLLLLSVASIVENSNSLDQPFPVYGYIKDSDGNAIPGGVTVTVKDNTKSTQISVTTQSNGYYQADLFNLQNCENGDTIEIYCSYSGEDNSKTFTLDVSQTSKNVSFSLVGKPDVSTNAASNVGSSSAKLNGELNDLKDTTCQVWFEYGKTTSYGSTTSKKTKTATGAFSATISGLQPDTTYHFRAVAKNSRKTSYGADKTFHTSPTPPQVTTNDASNVGYNSATLNGHLDKVGASSYCYVWFEYWNGEKHSTSVRILNSTGMFNESVEGLDDGETYYYRAIAVGSNGRISYGNIGNFSTDAMQNHEPYVVLISPDNNSIVNTDVSLMVDVGDEDGDMLEVSFYLNGNKIYSVESTGGTVSVAPALSYKENYEWYVSVSDGKALNISDIYEFSTIEEMIANFTNPMLFENEPAHFTDSSTGEIVQWLWDFGDGNTSNERNATHTYKKAGCYDVNLTVKDRYGNSMYIVKEIEVWQRGDANMDGSINALDVTRIERIAKHVDNEPSYPNPADVDRDNDVDNEDVHAVINKILGSV